MKLIERIEDIDTFYQRITYQYTGMSDVLNETRPYLLMDDIHKHYKDGIPNNNPFEHTFTFLWLILIVEGYEK